MDREMESHYFVGANKSKVYGTARKLKFDAVWGQNVFSDLVFALKPFN